MQVSLDFSQSKSIGFGHEDLSSNVAHIKEAAASYKYCTIIQGGPKKRPIVFQDLITALVIDIFARNFQR